MPLLVVFFTLLTSSLALAPHSSKPREGIQSFLYYSELRGDPNSTCSGNLNTLTPWTGALVKLKEVENGSLYTAGDEDDQLYGACVCVCVCVCVCLTHVTIRVNHTLLKILLLHLPLLHLLTQKRLFSSSSSFTNTTTSS